jgi:NADH-quinone oxidoreductase subunit H
MTHPTEPWYLVAFVAAIKAGFVLFVLLTFAGYAVWIERRVLARLQGRIGPNRAGFFGILQPAADVFKLLTKEESAPPFADKLLFLIAPALIMITSISTFAVIPFGRSDWLVVADSSVGILVVLALSSIGVYSIVLAGWASNSKYAVLGGLRATAQMISYELSMSLAILGVVMMAGTLNLREIVEAQSRVWFIIPQILGFFVFIVAIFAESRRSPFDLPEAENEIVAGFHTEYSSMKFALFFLGEYVGVLVLSSVAAVLYLGGWKGPGPEWLDPLWMVVKILGLFFIFIWARATLPRFRYDHLMELGWKWLIPLGILNLIITALLGLAFGRYIAPEAVY